MKATVEEINSVQRRLKVVVPIDAVNKAFDTAYNKMKKKAKIQGFRPGKAPLHMIKKLYAADVSNEVCDQLINSSLFTAINQENVKPIASPFVELKEVPKCDHEYEFSAVVDIMPSIDLDGHHKGLEITCSVYEATDASLERELDNLKKRHAKTTLVEDPETEAEKGHLTIISHTASIDGTELKDMDVKSAPIALGKDEIFPELEAGLIGMKKGESKELDIKIPAEYNDKDLSGKLVHFKIQLDELYGIDYPELDDEFAKDANYDSIADLKADLEKQLQESAKKANKQELEAKLLEKLCEKVSFEVPPAMVDQVIDGMIKEIRFKDEKEASEALRDKAIRESFRPEARTKAQNTMVLWEIIKCEELAVSDEDVISHVRQFANTDNENVEQQIENTISQFSERIKENLLFEKAIDLLEQSASVKKEPSEL